MADSRGPWLGLLLVASLAASARAQPAADLIVLWAPGLDPAPVAATARTLGAAFLDRSPAQVAPASLGAVVREAIAAYDALDLERAWGLLERTRDAIDRSGGAELDAGELSDLFAYRALVRIQQDDAPGGWSELVTAVAVDPQRVLDPARFPPKVRALFERARAEVLARPTATLLVDAPPGCVVRVDGRPLGGAVPRVAGEHWVQVSCADHRPWGTRIALVGDQRLVAHPVPLAPPTEAELLIQARTASARAFVVAAVRDGSGSARLIGIDGRERARQTVRIADSAAPLAEAIRRLAEPPPAPRPHVRWYESRWVWAGAAATIAAGILVPLTYAIAADDRDPSATIRGPR